MKKKLFSCFHPLALETETDQINVDPNKKGLTSKRPFSQVLEILLLKASLKIKVSDRKLSLQTKNARLRRIYRSLQIAAGDDNTGRDKGVEEAKVSHTEVRSSGSSCSSYESRSTTVGRPPLRSTAQSFDHEERRGRLMTKPCSCNKTNPGLYLLAVTLFFTVVWGRARAVLFALLFLYLFPMWAGFLR